MAVGPEPGGGDQQRGGHGRWGCWRSIRASSTAKALGSADAVEDRKGRWFQPDAVSSLRLAVSRPAGGNVSLSRCRRTVIRSSSNHSATIPSGTGSAWPAGLGCNTSLEEYVALAQAHSLLAYGLAFLVAGSEAIPIIGAAIPGTATIVALGALVPSGALQFWLLVVATTAGAIVGDGFSYWLGHHHRARAAAIWPLNRHPELIGQGEAFFARHGGKAIIIARFTPGVRAIVPLVAGVTGMPVARFYGVNVVSAVLWAPPHVMMGVVVGASLTVLGAIAGRLVALVLLISLLLVTAVWLTLRAVRWLSQVTMRLLDPVRNWVNSQDSWLRRQILSLLDPERPEVQGLMALGALLVAGLWLFLGILEDVLSAEPLVRADRAVFQLLQSLRVGPILIGS